MAVSDGDFEMFRCWHLSRPSVLKTWTITLLRIMTTAARCSFDAVSPLHPAVHGQRGAEGACAGASGDAGRGGVSRRRGHRSAGRGAGDISWRAVGGRHHGPRCVVAVVVLNLCFQPRSCVSACAVGAPRVPVSVRLTYYSRPVLLCAPREGGGVCGTSNRQRPRLLHCACIARPPSRGLGVSGVRILMYVLPCSSNVWSVCLPT